MPAVIWYALGGAGLLGAFGFAADKTGEAADSLTRLALAGAGAGLVVWYVTKRGS